MNAKKKICFIVNPVSGVGRQQVIEKLIDQSLARTLFDYEIIYTNAPKHATELAKQAAAANRFANSYCAQYSCCISEKTSGYSLDTSLSEI